MAQCQKGFKLTSALKSNKKSEFESQNRYFVFNVEFTK